MNVYYIYDKMNNARYLGWSISVRTALFAAGQYLRRVSIASGLKLFPEDTTQFKKYMQGPEYVTAHNIDETLFMRNNERRLSIMLGTSLSGIPEAKPRKTVYTVFHKKLGHKKLLSKICSLLL
jgi:hypothetical protein